MSETTNDLIIVTPPSLHLQPTGRRLLFASRNTETKGLFVDHLYDLWPDQMVALYLWDHEAPDAEGWLHHHLAYCDHSVLDLSDSDPFLLLMAGQHLARPELVLLASGPQAGSIGQNLNKVLPKSLFSNVEDVVKHMSTGSETH